jgi:hypothetical protein
LNTNESGSNEHSQKAMVKFDRIIKVQGRNAIAATYNLRSKDVFLVPNLNSQIPKINESCLVNLPREEKGSIDSYNGKDVYAVKVIDSFMIGGIDVYNAFIQDLLFKSFNGKTMVIIKDPNDNHNTHLVRIWTKKNIDDVLRFIKKDLPCKTIDIKNGIIEVIINGSENPEYLKKGFLEKLSDFISKLPET